MAKFKPCGPARRGAWHIQRSELLDVFVSASLLLRSSEGRMMTDVFLHKATKRLVIFSSSTQHHTTNVLYMFGKCCGRRTVPLLDGLQGPLALLATTSVGKVFISVRSSSVFN